MKRVRTGDRFRVSRTVESHVLLGRYAPSHTHGVNCVIPAGTVFIALEQRPGASAFSCYPEDYDRLEEVLIPESERESFRYANFYSLSFSASDIGDLLESLSPVEPRPPNRYPRVSGRPSPRQRADRARWDSLHTRINALEFDRITEVIRGVWVRRSRGSKGEWEVLGPEGHMVPLETCDIWFRRAPGDPPREADTRQPGGPFAATNRVWRYYADD